MKKYAVPNKEEIVGIMFDCEKRIRKSLKEILYFPKADKVFIAVGLLSRAGQLCSLIDGIQRFTIPSSKEYYISADWVVDENIDNSANEVKKLIENSRRSYINQHEK